MKARRSRLVTIALFLAGTVCAAFIMEAGLKVIRTTPLWRVLPVIEPILGQPDQDTGYVFTPGMSGVWTRENRAALTITDLGLRGPAGITTAKPPGTLRIALFGDSVTEALQVDYAATFGAQLQQQLTRDGRTVEVVNLAMSGNGPLRQLVRLEQRGYAFEPDIVLSVTSPFDFLTGELRDDSVNPGYVPDGRGGWTRGYAFRNRFSVREADSLMGRTFLVAIQQSEIARMLYLRSRERLPKLFGVEAAARPASAAAAQVDSCHSADLDRLQKLWQGHEPAADWAVMNLYFDELAASAAGRPVRLLYAMRDLPVPEATCTAQQAQRAALVATIEAFLATRGIVFIDLERRIVADTGAAGSSSLKTLRGFGLQLGQGHLNEDGHRRYAAALAALATPFLPR
jgi:hypothetical protein